MSETHIPLEYGAYYHIYNRGINSCPIFTEPSNYEYFLSLYENYISPVADTFAWVLMGNHFHLLVRIKEEKEIAYIPIKDKTKAPKSYIPINQFKHLFNAYAQAYNRKYKRTGALFETPFERILVDTDEYFKELVMYIHNNPVKHGFCSLPNEYPWSSYETCISDKATLLKREMVLEWFGDKELFKAMHSMPSLHPVSGFMP
jgi:putative transposase